MKKINLAVTPNQSFSILLDGHNYEITLKETRGVMSCTIIRDEITILSGCRIVAGYPLIPYEYLETGNFIFLTDNDELPNWEKFSTQTLLYASQAELEVITNV
ncbi:hypothetical protein LPW36_01940 [Jinshanibacter sp. LJY008]|uniref:Cyanophage baseplate Pam3 plug gp18 domain-containing protein n=1 Tax=Limnobaculum eriocheiris TaxID=2897391 RepID=A0A9X1SJP9_9GAMM|nr:hypothetical protein [Limnobaculum eriocheiris]MCD1124805.1 hypothetical protein [Limnobaculum eriocheiris]